MSSRRKRPLPQVGVYTAQEYAALCGVGYRLVLREAGNGGIPGAFQVGRSWRIPKTAFPKTEILRDGKSAAANDDTAA